MFWILWLALACVAFGGELLSVALYLASFGAAALVTAGISLAAPLPVQLACFVLLSVVFLFAVRPAALRMLPAGAETDDNPRIGPIGRRATVVHRIDTRGGQIRVGRGEFWSARAVTAELVIEPDREVEVAGMDGLTALVRPVTRQAVSTPVDGNRDPFGLSPREIEVLGLIAAGLSNGEIAERLVLSPRTVHHHVTHIFNKMNVDSRVDAARLAMRHGLTTGEDDPF